MRLSFLGSFHAARDRRKAGAELEEFVNNLRLLQPTHPLSGCAIVTIYDSFTLVPYVVVRTVAQSVSGNIPTRLVQGWARRVLCLLRTKGAFMNEPPGQFTQSVELMRQLRERIAALIARLAQSPECLLEQAEQGSDAETE